MLLFWILMIVLGISGTRYIFDQPQSQLEQRHKQKRSPLERLQERYARGEISRDEYHTIIDDINNQQENLNVY